MCILTHNIHIHKYIEGMSIFTSSQIRSFYRSREDGEFPLSLRKILIEMINIRMHLYIYIYTYPYIEGMSIFSSSQIHSFHHTGQNGEFPVPLCDHIYTYHTCIRRKMTCIHHNKSSFNRSGRIRKYKYDHAY
jgi:hypothetical protein